MPDLRRVFIVQRNTWPITYFAGELTGDATDEYVHITDVWTRDINQATLLNVWEVSDVNSFASRKTFLGIAVATEILEIE